jgi:hypothetical protein
MGQGPWRGCSKAKTPLLPRTVLEDETPRRRLEALWNRRGRLWPFPLLLLWLLLLLGMLLLLLVLLLQLLLLSLLLLLLLLRLHHLPVAGQTLARRLIAGRTVPVAQQHAHKGAAVHVEGQHPAGQLV